MPRPHILVPPHSRGHQPQQCASPCPALPLPALATACPPSCRGPPPRAGSLTRAVELTSSGLFHLLRWSPGAVAVVWDQRGERPSSRLKSCSDCSLWSLVVSCARSCSRLSVSPPGDSQSDTVRREAHLHDSAPAPL